MNIKQFFVDAQKSFAFWFSDCGVDWDFENDSKFKKIGKLINVYPNGKFTQLNISDGSIYVVHDTVSGIKLGEDVFIGRGHVGYQNRKYLLK